MSSGCTHYADMLQHLPQGDQAKIMGANLAGLLSYDLADHPRDDPHQQRAPRRRRVQYFRR
jgi:hypothetical protein